MNIMEFIKRYFDSVEEADTFIQLINNVLSIPISEDAITRTYVDYEADEDGIYVMYESYINELL